VPTLQDDWESAVSTTKPKSLGLEDDWKNSQSQSEWESAEPEEGETEGKNTVINSLQDIARFFITPATAGLSAIGTGIGEAAAGGELSTGLTKGAQSEEFKGIPFVDISLGAETTPGKWVEEKLGKILGSIREFGGEKAPELIKNETSREVMKALPGIGSLVRLYEELPEDGKSTIEAALSAGGAAAPEVLLMLLGGKGAKKLVEKEPTIAGETSTIDSMLADLEQQVPTTKLKEELSLVPREEIPIIESAIEQRISERTVGELDPIYEEAVAHVIEKGRAAVSDVRRKFGISADRAERLIGEMEKQGLVTTELTNGSRKLVKEPTQEGMIINASGESVASAEAISRLQDQNAKGIKVYEVDPERNGLTPLNTVDRVDKKPAKGNAIVSVGGDGTMTVIENNSRFGNEPLKNRTVSLIEKDLGLTGAGKGQRGAIGFKQEPKTLEQKAKTLTREDWTKEFTAKYPDKVQHADTIYDKLNPQKPTKISSKRGLTKKTLEGIDYYAGLVSTRIGNISPRIEQVVRNSERKRMVGTAEGLDTSDKFLTDLNRTFSKEQKIEIDNLLLDNNLDAVKAGLPPKLANELSKITDKDGVLDKLGDAGVARGIIENKRPNYWPRAMKDADSYAGLRDALGLDQRTRLDVAMKEAQLKAIKNGTFFGSVEQAMVIDKFMGSYPKQKGGAGYSKSRVFDTIPDELKQFFAPPTKSLHSYIRWMNDKIAEHDFFGKSLKKNEDGSVNLNSSIGEYIGRLLAEGKLKPEKVDELQRLIEARFVQGQDIPHGAVQAYKDINNLTLLTEFTTTLSQIADMAPSLAINRIRPTLQAAAYQLLGKNKENVKQVAGILDNFAEEFVGNRKSSDWVIKAFRATGFTKLGRFSQNVIINAARIARTEEAKLGRADSRLYDRFKEAFGEDFAQLVDDLKNNRKTLLTDQLLFSELSNIQPISKLQKPEFVLRNPNVGGILYSLKSYVGSQVDVYRREVYNEYRKGNVVKATKTAALLSIYYGASQVALEDLKAIWANKPLPDRSNLQIALASLKMMGIDQYFSDKLKNGEFVGAASVLISPPGKQLDLVGKDIVGGINLGLDKAYGKDGLSPRRKPDYKSLTLLPGFGDAVYGYGTEAGEKRRKKLEKKQQLEKQKERRR